MSKVKLTEVQKEKIAEFLSEQLTTLKTEKRLGRMHYDETIDEDGEGGKDHIFHTIIKIHKMYA